MKHCKEWDCNGINHLPTGAGFLPSTVWTPVFQTSAIPSISHLLAQGNGFQQPQVYGLLNLLQWPPVSTAPVRERCESSWGDLTRTYRTPIERKPQNKHPSISIHKWLCLKMAYPQNFDGGSWTTRIWSPCSNPQQGCVDNLRTGTPPILVFHKCRIPQTWWTSSHKNETCWMSLGPSISRNLPRFLPLMLTSLSGSRVTQPGMRQASTLNINPHKKTSQ